jgi:Ger(x)C family germination protein
LFKNRSKLIAMLVLVSFLLTGCWDATEVNELNLSTMVILDRMGDQLLFTVEIAKIAPAGESGGGGGQKKQSYLTGSGKSLSEAREDVEMQADKPLFLGTVRALVLTEAAAANDFPEYLFRLRENQQYRQKVNIVVTGDEPKALTEFENENDQPAGFVIDDTIHTAQSLGHTCAVSTEEYLNDILSKRGFVIQHMKLQDKQLKIDGYSVFRDAKLTGFIPIESSHGMAYLVSSNPVWVYRLPGDGGFVTAEVTLGHREIKPSYQDGKIKFQVQIAFKATIQYKSDISLFPLNHQNIRKYSDELNQVLVSEVRTAIEQSQKQFQSDYLLFGEYFRVAYPDEYERMDWQTEYLSAEINTSTSVDITVSDKMDIEAS